MYYFYAFNKEKFILLTNLTKPTVKKKFGLQFELVQSVKDFNAVEILKARILKQYPTFQLKTQVLKFVTFTPEIREKLRQAKLGIKKPQEVKDKISRSRKGKGNFLGKKHKEESKKSMSLKRKGKRHRLGQTYTWIYSPSLDKEHAYSGKGIPLGFVKGRTPDMKEIIRYNFLKYRNRLEY